MAARPLALLALPTFRDLWLAGALIGIMRWLELLVLGVHVFATTGSPLLTALMTVLRMLPLALAGAVVGTLAERIDQRRLLLQATLSSAAASLALALLALTGRAPLPALGTIAVLGGLLWACEFPVRRVLLAGIAGRERLGAAMGLESATVHATRMLGPAIGGMLYAVGGLGAVYLLGAALHLWAALCLRRLPAAPPAPTGRRGRLLSDLAEALRHLRRAPLIAAALAVTVLVNLFGFPYTSMVPVIGETVLGQGPAAVGLLMAADGAGALCGALSLAWVVRPRHFPRVLLFGTALFLLAVLGFSAIPAYGLALAVLFGAGLGLAGFSTMQPSLILAAAPFEMRARMMGLLTVSIGTGPLGFLLMGALADLLGAPRAVALSATIGLAALAAALLAWPALCRPLVEQPEAQPPVSPRR